MKLIILHIGMYIFIFSGGLSIKKEFFPLQSLSQSLGEIEISIFLKEKYMFF